MRGSDHRELAITTNGGAFVTAITNQDAMGGAHCPRVGVGVCVCVCSGRRKRFRAAETRKSTMANNLGAGNDRQG